MILLHLILSNTPSQTLSLPPETTLITDVEKSLDIFRSMDNVLVARRCAEMIREVLDVAKAVVERRRRNTNQRQGVYQKLQPGALFPDYTTANDTDSALGASESGTAVFTPDPDTGTGHEDGLAMGDFFSSLFVGLDSSVPGAGFGSGTGTGPGSSGDFDDGTRAGVLANLVDPSILGDFAFGGGGYGSGGGG
ncbi:hypothetical protein PHISCL_09245 [Aspergillus sclerotialis]|uniref:Uncharacterized protein n=1 Tax=Aspergillus sclerotialis TaxID=2070753 RepID=A0A3A2Z6G2_9EURO|nr:hypothetical protein PHISCL_09245 [Aspergillus sclerotialis]